MILVWNLKPGEKQQGWIIRPYHNYAADLSSLRKQDWAQEMERGKKEWCDLLGLACKLSIPDASVSNAYLDCLADIFIMREPLADGRIIAVPGTEKYRAGNSVDPLVGAVALDQNGLHKESAAGSSISLDMQEPDGCWADKRGRHKQSMWLIDYTIGKEKYTNHYLAGEAPFKLDDYQRWYKKLNIKRD